MERINIEQELGDDNEYNSTAVVNDFFINLNGGENKMFFDDTFAKMDVYGGTSDDGKFRFWIVDIISCIIESQY